MSGVWLDTGQVQILVVPDSMPFNDGASPGIVDNHRITITLYSFGNGSGSNPTSVCPGRASPIEILDPATFRQSARHLSLESTVMASLSQNWGWEYLCANDRDPATGFRRFCLQGRRTSAPSSLQFQCLISSRQGETLRLFACGPTSVVQCCWPLAASIHDSTV